MSENTLCIIIPCYNEAKRLDLERFLEFAKHHSNFSFCFANDGSKDNTSAILSDFCKLNAKQFFFIGNAVNKGKAETIRHAALHCHEKHSFTFVAYLDADMATPLEEMTRLFDMAQQHPESIIVMGTRLRRMGAQVTRTAARHYLGRVFATLASMSLSIPVYDTQCGAKIIRASYIPKLFGKAFISKWFFDIEILKRLLSSENFKLQLSSIIEVPLNQWHAVDGSKVKLKDFLIAPLELIRIHQHYPAPKIGYDELIPKYPSRTL
jgi:dolichyl-phosphate beta-glucosyltransferase